MAKMENEFCIENGIKYNYDKENEVLYLTFADKKNSYGDDSIPHFIVLRDMDTEQITGITIFISSLFGEKNMTVIERAKQRLEEESKAQEHGADNDHDVAYWRAYIDGAEAQKKEFEKFS